MKIICQAIALAFLSQAATAADFETPVPLPIEQAVPPALLEASVATLRDPVANDGVHNRYELRSDAGAFTVKGVHALCKLIRELNAIEEISRLEGTRAFSESAIEAARELGTGAKNLLTRPVRTLGGAARGVGKAFRRLGDRFVQGKESSAVEDNSFETLIGFSKVKREYAYDFGVDVYSNNETLQRYLDQLAWTGFSGSLAFNLTAAVATGGAAAAALSVTNYTYALEEMIRDSAPSDLRAQTREELRTLGINEDLANAFIRNRALSPRHQVFIAGALRTMDGVAGREHLLRRASRAETYETGFDRQVQTQMYAQVHAETPLREFIDLDGQVLARARDGAIVAVLPVDQVYWTEGVATAVRQAEALLAERGLDGPRHVWLLGGLSHRAREELEARGWAVHAGLVERFLGDQCNPSVPEVALDG